MSRYQELNRAPLRATVEQKISFCRSNSDLNSGLRLAQRLVELDEAAERAPLAARQRKAELQKQLDRETKGVILGSEGLEG
eukprot:Skav216428  [mRNA]  locus=scaffold3139:291371:291767:- [translate_table: standard]